MAQSSSVTPTPIRGQLQSIRPNPCTLALPPPQKDDRDIHVAEVASFDAKSARDTAAELTTDGEKLFILLQSELGHEEHRSKIVTRPSDQAQV